MNAMQAARALPGEPPLGEVLEFMRLLWAVAHGMDSVSRQMKTALGVTGRQRLVLRVVGQFPGITATQLADVLHLHPSTLTGVVKLLVKRGLLDRQEDERDARRAFLHLTENGRALDVPANGTVEHAVHRLLLRIPESQRLEAQALLTELAKELLPCEEDLPPATPSFPPPLAAPDSASPPGAGD